MDIFLGVTKIFQEEIGEKNKEKILKSNKYKCSSCGCSIKKSSYIHKESEGKSISSYKSLCDVCFYTIHLEMLTFEDSGKIIMLPEISQKELLCLIRSIELIKSLRVDFEEEADSVEIIEVLLKERAELAETYYAPGVSNVDLFTQVLYSLSDKEYALREKGFYNLRWLPNMDNFKEHQEEWNESYKNFNPNEWKKLIKKMAK